MVSCLDILTHSLDTRYAHVRLQHSSGGTPRQHVCPQCSSVSLRTVMKSGSELVKAGFRTFFENAAEDLEKLVEMLKLGKFMQSRAQMKSVSQSINYVTAALLPILTALFDHIKTHEFGIDLLRESHPPPAGAL